MAEQTFCLFCGCANEEILILISSVYVCVIKQNNYLKTSSQVLMVKSKMCNFR